MAQIKEQIKTPEKELSNEEINNLLDAEFKTLLTITEMIEFSRKIKEEIKAMKGEIKENIQGTKSEGKENWDSNKKFGTKGRNKHPTGTE